MYSDELYTGSSIRIFFFREKFRIALLFGKISKVYFLYKVRKTLNLDRGIGSMHSLMPLNSLM